MESLTLFSDTLGFGSGWLFLAIVPVLLILVMELSSRRRRTTVAMTGIEFLRKRHYLGGRSRQVVRILLAALLTLLLGLAWMEPVLQTATPVFTGGQQLTQKHMIIAVDISRSMGQPLEVLSRDERFARYGAGEVVAEDQPGAQSRYESARETIYHFIDRFSGARIGLILFSTEPFLARWPTTETDNKFIEVLEERIGPREKSQLQRFSSLTNIDMALSLSREIFSRQQGGGAVILISDAEDEFENLGVAIRTTRAEGIRLYTIGVGISEAIVENLSAEFAGDPGFRIFHVDSESEMEEAYQLVSDLEESPVYTSQEQLFITDLRWIIALVLLVAGVLVVALNETLFHQAMVTER